MKFLEKKLYEKYVLSTLAKLPFEYMLLREPMSWADTGDVDILAVDFALAQAELSKLGFIEVHSDICTRSRKFIKLDPHTSNWLHLDIHAVPDVENIEWPPDFVREMYNKSIIGKDGISRLTDSETCLLILLKAVSKSYISKNYLRLVCHLDTNDISHYAFLPQESKVYKKWVCEYLDKKITVDTLLQKCSDGFNVRGPEHKVSIIKRLTNRVKSIFNYNPIVFLGPDGSGKSSLVAKMDRIKWPRTCVKYMGPHRKQEMRSFLFKWLDRLAKIRDVNSRKSIFGIITRIIYQLLCYIDFLDRYYRNVWRHGSGERVIFDRFACDVYFRKPTILNEVLFVFLFPRPRKVFLCVGDPEKIYERKQEELSVAEISSAIQLYRKKLKSYGISFIEVNTTELNETESAEFVVRNIYQ